MIASREEAASSPEPGVCGASSSGARRRRSGAAGLPGAPHYTGGQAARRRAPAADCRNLRRSPRRSAGPLVLGPALVVPGPSSRYVSRRIPPQPSARTSGNRGHRAEQHPRFQACASRQRKRPRTETRNPQASSNRGRARTAFAARISTCSGIASSSRPFVSVITQRTKMNDSTANPA